jgi:peptide deformylase
MDPLKIVLYPDDILCKPCRELTQDELGSGQVNGRRIDELVDHMAMTMVAKGGVGLAAPQVGIPLRMFVCHTSTSPGKPFAIVNPVIKEVSGNVVDFEGCLSLPGISAKIERGELVVVSGNSPKGEYQVHTFQKFDARVVQHEMDHLDGVVFLQRMAEDEYLKLMRNVRAISSPPKIDPPSPKGTTRNLWSSGPRKKR